MSWARSVRILKVLSRKKNKSRIVSISSMAHLGTKAHAIAKPLIPVFP